MSNRDLLFFTLGASTPTSLDSGASYIAVLIGGDVATTGSSSFITNQGGDTSFTQVWLFISDCS